MVGERPAASDPASKRQEETMIGLTSRSLLVAGSALALVSALAAPAAAQSAHVPNLQSGPGGWTHPFHGAFPPVQGSALPVQQDPGHPYVNAILSNRIGDISNPNLKPWAKEVMKKDIDEIDAGKIEFSAGSSCLPAGVPAFMQLPGPFYFLQTPTKVVILEEQDHAVRSIYLNVPHSADVKPSWYGESVGRYEGDTLVVDTIGLNTKTMVDLFRTPHTEKLHVVERWHLIDGGNMLEVNITVDDPDTFHRPWQTYQRYQRRQRPLEEFVCAENNQHLFDLQTPTSDKPDF
jgi:hypothetical protein